MDQKTCAGCGLPFTPNNWKQVRCDACRFAPSLRPRRKITESDVIAIRRRCDQNEPLAQISADYGITVSTISDIKHRHIWRHVA